MFRSFPFCSCGVGYCQSRMILSGNLALKNFCPLSFIDRELPLFSLFFFFFTSFRSLIGNPSFLSSVLFFIFLFLFFFSFFPFLPSLFFTFPSPSLSLGNRVLAFHSLSLEEIPLSFASGERMRIPFLQAKVQKGLRLCLNGVFYRGNPILISGAKQIWVSRCRSRAKTLSLHKARVTMMI